MKHPPRGRGKGRGRGSNHPHGSARGRVSNGSTAQQAIVDSILAHESRHHSGLGYRTPQEQEANHKAAMIKPSIHFVRGVSQPLLMVDPVKDTAPLEDATFYTDPAPVSDLCESEEEDVIVFIPPPGNAPSLHISEATVADALTLNDSIEAEKLISSQSSQSSPTQADSTSASDLIVKTLSREECPSSPHLNSSLLQGEEPISTPEAESSTKQSAADAELPSSIFKRQKLTSSQKRKLKREGRARRKSASKHRASLSYAAPNGLLTEIDCNMHNQEDFYMPASIRKQNKGKGKARSMDADLLDDYRQNAMEADFSMASFVKSLDISQMTIDDIDVENDLTAQRAMLASEETDWQTDDDSDDILSMDEAEVIRLEEHMLIGESSSSDDASSDGAENLHALHESKSGSSSDEDEDEDEDDEDSDNDEDVEAQMNKWFSDPTDPNDKLFKAIESGDFDDLEDDLLASYGQKRSRKQNRKKMPAFDSDDEFVAQMQEQWLKDRQKKSDRKKARAEARLRNHPTKAAIKAAKRAGVELSPVQGVDLNVIHERIKFFLSSPEKPHLSLPPMSKKDRVAVHLLAECYYLKSQSKGSGAKRFPMLMRTAMTSLAGADHAKIGTILGAARGDPKAMYQGGRTKGRTNALWKELSGQKSSGKSTPLIVKNRDGDVVGQGASEISSDNIGYKLLMKMGWDESKKIGLQGGLATPLSAIIKTNRGGLGA